MVSHRRRLRRMRKESSTSASFGSKDVTGCTDAHRPASKNVAQGILNIHGPLKEALSAGVEVRQIMPSLYKCYGITTSISTSAVITIFALQSPDVLATQGRAGRKVYTFADASLHNRDVISPSPTRDTREGCTRRF